MKSKGDILQPRCAFTIVEVLVAVAVLALLGTGAVAGLLSINRVVVANRLATNAQAIAQSTIDRLLSEPYPEGSSAPPDLAPGSTVVSNIPIYTDPGSGAVIVTGNVTTTITDISRTIVAGQPASSLLRASVVVGYNFGGKANSVVLSTVRAVD